MKRSLLCSFIFLAYVTVSAQTKKVTPKPPVKNVVTAPLMKNLLDSFSYAAGLNIAANMKAQGISSINHEMMQRAISDVFQNKKPLLTNEMAGMKLQEQLAAFSQKKSAGEKAKGAAFLAENKKRPGVTTLPSGMQYEIIIPGEPNGVKPTAVDTVVVHYAGKLINAVEDFDSSIKNGQPATFSLGRVIKGWTDILQMMTKGAKWKVFIPSELAYGDRGFGGAIPPGATLIFEINLLEIKPFVK